MTTDIINEVACELGISATNIIPELTKLKIMQNAFWCCVCIVTTLLCLFISIKASKKEYPDDVLIGFCIFMIFVLSVAAIGFGYDLAKWLTSPQISALQYFVNEMR